MKVLIACEFSGIVRDAFIARGHDAISCDLLPSERPGPHYWGDVRDIINDGWDLMIAHPPCKYLSYAANHVWNNPGRAELREQAMAFFMLLVNAPVARICVENPLGYPCKAYRKADQIIHPYYFGDPYKKRTLLWLKNLPTLVYGTVVEPPPVYWRRGVIPVHYTESLGGHRVFSRSRFFLGVAKAMAEQWGVLDNS